ncbi:hypothetical protein LTR86_003139 [Recurvomyces mirabilis]|nr:hypothetical protein LTR86_003139 [Recurvomyces mirabilis]
MEMTIQNWKSGTPDIVEHHVLADYIREAVERNDILGSIHFNTRVMDVRKEDRQWHLTLAERIENDIRTRSEVFMIDTTFTITRVWHSKRYRRPDQFKNKNVLLVGAGVSSKDIANDLGAIAKQTFQSSRGGMYDLPSHMLPDNAFRICGIERFDDLSRDSSAKGGSIPGTVTLTDGRKVCNIDYVILCTGYHVSLPFMRQYHADGVLPGHASEEVLVTNGQLKHNLHKDIWYIPDPTLAFIGVLFEFQAMAVARIFAGEVVLPSREAMRTEYKERISRKGAARTLHSLKGYGEELAYVRELMAMVNTPALSPARRMTGHSVKFLESYERRRAYMQTLLGRTDQKLLEQYIEC